MEENMPVLDCSVRTCYYNKENSCCLDAIKVEGTTAEVSSATECSSFKERTGESLTNGCCGSPSCKLSVDCMAEKCMFNSGHSCTAKHIDISGRNAHRSEDTECDSFEMR